MSGEQATMREVMARLPRTRSIAAAVVAALALAAAPARAFDAGPHTDMTRDALAAEGFGLSAANVGVVENWFVDYYWNAKENPFSGHGDMLTEMLANADPAVKEYWPQFVVDGTNHMHFDSSQPGFPDLSNPQGVDEEWQRLMRVTRNALATAKSTRDPLTVTAIVGPVRPAQARRRRCMMPSGDGDVPTTSLRAPAAKDQRGRIQLLRQG